MDLLQDSVVFLIVEVLAAVFMIGKWHRMQGLCNRLDVAIDEGLVFEALDAPRSVSWNEVWELRSNG